MNTRCTMVVYKQHRHTTELHYAMSSCTGITGNTPFRINVNLVSRNQNYKTITRISPSTVQSVVAFSN